MRRLLRPLLVLATSLGVGCATPAGVRPDPALLDFLADGVTPRSEVLLRLGEPSGFFEGDRILTYRIAGDERHGRWVQGRALLGGSPLVTLAPRASLVLVFDPQGVLERHALIAVEQ